jgi:hypothetical protein
MSTSILYAFRHFNYDKKTFFNTVVCELKTHPLQKLYDYSK